MKIRMHFQRKVSNSLVSIIIVNWNGRDHLTGCLDSLQRIIYPTYEVILVDNGSTDGSMSFVRRSYPHAKIIHNKENLGFAEGNNIGLREANGDYILFLNNDTKVEPNFLTELLKVMKSDLSIAACESKILFMDGSGRTEGVGSYLTSSGVLYHCGYGKKDGDRFKEIVEVFSAKGSCLLVRRAVLDEIGMFDKDFFAYFEETDLCWRVWLAGHRVVFVPTSIVYHRGGSTASQLPSSLINFHSFKNRICSLVKNLGTASLFKIVPKHIFLCLGITSIYLLAGKFGDAHGVAKAIVWNIIHSRDTLRKRLIVQEKIRKVSDRELMPKIMRKVNLLYYYHLLRGDLENWGL